MDIKEDNVNKTLKPLDSNFLSYARSMSIFVIIFGHVGGFWILKPYSGFLYIFVPLFFFISGSVSFYSFQRSLTTGYYYKKRIVGLLTPYYLLCIFSLLIFFVINRNLPAVTLTNLMGWLQLQPVGAPFPIGQVWFLNTLFFIILMSPLFFIIHERNKYILPILILCILAMSGIELLIDIHHYFQILGQNLYKPLIHSSFFMFGIICFSPQIKKHSQLSMFTMIIILGVILSYCLVHILHLDVDYESHTFSPDLYYVTGSFVGISFILVLKRTIVWVIQRSRTILFITNFIFKHTMSMYLLHSFAIFFSEKVFGLVNPPNKNIQYGIVKLSVVLCITAILSIPFTHMSKKVISSVLKTS